MMNLLLISAVALLVVLALTGPGDGGGHPPGRRRPF
jgi:hypothetical protein